MASETDAVFGAGEWYHEKILDGVVVSYEKSAHHHHSQTEFQVVDVIDTKGFGICLITDNVIQSSGADEHSYHEALVQPAMIGLDSPKRVFIGGGGEGATLREVLKHASVEQCVMADIDGVVVETCRKLMPEFSNGAYDDPRTKLVIDDCRAELERHPDGYFDLIILDLSDPLDGGPCYQLYTVEFYEVCIKKLHPGGALVTQCGFASVADCALGVFPPVRNTIAQVFPIVQAYTSHVPSFTSEWGFVIGTKKPLDFSDIDGKIARLQLTDKLRYYDAETHLRLFSLCKGVRQVLGAETRVMRHDNFMFMVSSSVQAGVNKK